VPPAALPLWTNTNLTKEQPKFRGRSSLIAQTIRVLWMAKTLGVCFSFAFPFMGATGKTDLFFKIGRFGLFSSRILVCVELINYIVAL
jgi:ABC-type antimicrobial peptide transport system permease subunit